MSFVYLQMFTYPSISPVNAISGVISPTTFSLIASPVATPRTTPRTTPIPRWTTPFGTLDENMDYSSMATFTSGNSNEEELLAQGGSISNHKFSYLINCYILVISHLIALKWKFGTFIHPSKIWNMKNKPQLPETSKVSLFGSKPLVTILTRQC